VYSWRREEFVGRRRHGAAPSASSSTCQISNHGPWLRPRTDPP